MEIKKGDKLFFKGKHGMYYEVTVKSVQGDYAFIKGSYYIGHSKVRLDKLVKQPPKEFQEFSRRVEKELNEAQEILWRIKDNR